MTSAEAGWDRGLLSPSKLRLAPRTGFALSLDDGRAVVRGGYGVFLNQWAYSVQTAFARNLPFFYTRQIDVPATQRVPAFTTATMLASDPTGVVAPTIMDHDYRVEYTQTWSGGLQFELIPSTAIEVAYMGSWTLGADNATVHNVPEPGSGSIQARRPIPQLGPIRSIRFDGKSIYHGVTIKAEQRLRRGYCVQRQLHALDLERRCVEPGADRGGDELPAERAQHLRRERRVGAFELRPSTPVRRERDVPAAVDGRGLRAILGGWRINAIFTAQSGAPFTVNLGVDQANIGAGPSQRPDQIRDPNLPAGDRTPQRWFDTDAFALPAAFTFGNAPRNSVIGPGFVNLDFVVARTWPVGRNRGLEFRWEVFNALNAANFDLPNRIFGTPNFGRIFSAKNPREMQVGIKLTF